MTSPNDKSSPGLPTGVVGGPYRGPFLESHRGPCKPLAEATAPAEGMDEFNIFLYKLAEASTLAEEASARRHLCFSLHIRLYHYLPLLSMIIRALLLLQRPLQGLEALYKMFSLDTQGNWHSWYTWLLCYYSCPVC